MQDSPFSRPCDKKGICKIMHRQYRRCLAVQLPVLPKSPIHHLQSHRRVLGRLLGEIPSRSGGSGRIRQGPCVPRPELLLATSPTPHTPPLTTSPSSLGPYQARGCCLSRLCPRAAAWNGSDRPREAVAGGSPAPQAGGAQLGAEQLPRKPRAEGALDAPPLPGASWSGGQTPRGARQPVPGSACHPSRNRAELDARRGRWRSPGGNQNRAR